MVGLPERSGAGLQPAGQACGQHLNGGFQRAIPAGVPERELVPVPGGGCREGGILAKTLQCHDRRVDAVEEPVQADPLVALHVGLAEADVDDLHAAGAAGGLLDDAQPAGEDLGPPTRG